MDDVPILLYRGMSDEEYYDAERLGRFQSGQGRMKELRVRAATFREMLEAETDEEERREIAADLEAVENEIQAREFGGEEEFTFWADSYADAAQYGEVVVTIHTRGIESLFSPFPGRPGEWVSSEPVPFDAMHGAQLQLHRTQFETRMARRPVRVHRHLRRLK